MNDFTDSKRKRFRMSVSSEYFHTKFFSKKSGIAMWIRECQARKWRWLYEHGDILRNYTVGGNNFSKNKTHTITCITGHKLFFVYLGLITRIAIFFTLFW